MIARNRLHDYDDCECSLDEVESAFTEGKVSLHKLQRHYEREIRLPSRPIDAELVATAVIVSATIGFVFGLFVGASIQ